jgi:hypothetical protein
VMVIMIGVLRETVYLEANDSPGESPNIPYFMIVRGQRLSSAC